MDIIAQCLQARYDVQVGASHSGYQQFADQSNQYGCGFGHGEPLQTTHKSPSSAMPIGAYFYAIRDLLYPPFWAVPALLRTHRGTVLNSET